MKLAMRTKVYLSGLTAVIVPIILLLFPKIVPMYSKMKYKTIIRFNILFLYMAVILYFTVMSRSSGNTSQINLVPFWSYTKFSHEDVRWQIYMNVFLFIIFGFLIPWATNLSFLQTIILGCIFSMFVEILQYYFRVGLCEFDDVFHNTLGTALGYLYWKLLCRIYLKHCN